MLASRWRLACVLLPLAALALADCSKAKATSTTGAPGSGGYGGQGGTGGSLPFTTSASSTGGGGSGGAKSCPMGAATNIPKGQCDLYLQDCPAGETCVPYPTANPTATTCQGPTGLKGPGETCVADPDCAAGLFCIGSVCTPVCCPADGDPCPGKLCTTTVTLGPNAFISVCSYADTCVLLTKNACPAGQQCHVADRTVGLSQCDTPSTNTGPCMYLNDCGDMQTCSAGTCFYNCYTNKPGQPVGLGGCPPGQSCTPGAFGIPDVGLCQ